MNKSDFKNNKKHSALEVYNTLSAFYGQVDKMPRNTVTSKDASALVKTYGPDKQEIHRQKVMEYWNEQSGQSDKEQDS